MDEVANLPLAAAREVQDRVLPRAEKQTVAQMRRSLARAILAVDPAHSARKTGAALAGRRVSIWAQAPGVACLGATMQADHALEIYNELDRRARMAPSDDPRPIDARRSDALLALCLPDLYANLDPSGEQPWGMCAPPRKSRRVIRVTMSRDALIGLTDSPAVLEGHGPIPAELGRHLAADAEWERWILQPETGELLDAGALTYVPSKRFAEFLAKRDSTCRFPGCGRPATRCDVEHAEPFNHSDPKAGGKTTRRNLVKC